MANIDEFIAYLEEEVKNHSIYVWGGCGQKSPTITEDWIRRMENSTNNANRAIAYWKKQVNAGYKNKLKSFDCSGLGSYWLIQKGVIPSKYNAQMLRTACTPISKSQLKKGDFVFRVSQNNAYHVGYVVDNNLNVIESKGRDNGVVKGGLTKWGSTYWNDFRRPSKFFSTVSPITVSGTLQNITTKWTVSRILKKTSPYMTGDDVRNVQNALLSKGYDVGSTAADGVFGTGTQRAVTQYQTKSGLTADGIVGQKTVESLGGVWKSPSVETRFTISRELYYNDPMMRGDDVSSIQSALKDAGYSPGTIDGVFGMNTDSSVRSFQNYNGLSADGIVGQKTVQKLGGIWSV